MTIRALHMADGFNVKITEAEAKRFQRSLNRFAELVDQDEVPKELRNEARLLSGNNKRAGGLMALTPTATASSIRKNVNWVRDKRIEKVNDTLKGRAAGQARRRIRAQARKELAERRENRGMAKAGWLAAARHFGNRSFPAYVSKHGTKFGRFLDDSARKLRHMIEVTSLVVHSVELDKKHRILSRAVKGRTANMLKKIEKSLHDRWRDGRG